MSLYEKIQELCCDEGITVTAMCRETGLSRGSITDLKSGRIKSLSADSVAKIADYFSVTIDYLLGLEPKNAYTLTTLLKQGKYREYEKLLGLPEGSIQPLPKEEAQKWEEESREERSEQKKLFWLLKAHINKKLPHFCRYDLEDIMLYIDLLAAKKERIQ